MTTKQLTEEGIREEISKMRTEAEAASVLGNPLRVHGSVLDFRKFEGEGSSQPSVLLPQRILGMSDVELREVVIAASKPAAVAYKARRM